MTKVMISRTEYAKLRRQASAYQKLTRRLFESVVHDPVQEVVEDFHKTGLYSSGFLKDLETGLRKSSYIKRS